MTKKTETQNRPPIIVIVGHIDHGKSTLLDYIRKSNIVAGEAGGITQHTSAYEVVHETKDGKKSKITFLDTPGHEAFTTMRDRGAQIADIAILIVSAEDGVKAQTLEALKSIKAAEVPYIVAITKIDKPNANIDRVKQNLGEHEVFIEEYGGTIPCVPISSKTGAGIDDLLDMMLLVAEVSELTGDHTKPGEGFVLESRLDSKAGIMATLVVTDGTVNTGDYIVVDGEAAKIKKLEDFTGAIIKTATFSSPIQVLGWTAVPMAGSRFTTFTDKKLADKFAEAEKATIAATNTLKTLDQTPPEEGAIEVPVIIKADVLGTLEAVERELGKLNTSRAVIKIISRGVGPISENDVKLAGLPSSLEVGTNTPMILGFNVKIDKNAKDLAEKNKLVPQTFDIIYKMTEWAAEEIIKRIPKITVEEVAGKLKLLKTFSVNGDKQVVGGEVFEGKLMKGLTVNISRRSSPIGQGRIVELQQQMIKVSEVLEGNQCGLLVDSKITLAPGDVLEAITLTEK